MSVFGVILVHKFPHPNWIRRDADQNNSEYGHFSRRESLWSSVNITTKNVYHDRYNTYKVNHTSPSKISVFDSSAVLGSDDSNQNGDVSKSTDSIEKFDFIITLLKDRISLLEHQLIEKNTT